VRWDPSSPVSMRSLKPPAAAPWRTGRDRSIEVADARSTPRSGSATVFDSVGRAQGLTGAQGRTARPWWK
jgi:hypothetical protein